jgi:hypothetical protein
VQPSDIRTLIPLETEPPEILEDAGFRLPRRALDIGVFDAEDEDALLTVRQQPVEERRTGVPDVELTGGTGSKSYAH